MSLEYLLNDENEDEILAKVQEESLRYYQEVELPRISDESYGVSDVSKTPTKEDEGSKLKVSASSTSGIVSLDAIADSSVLCTQVGGKAGALLFEGNEAKGFHLAAGSTYIYPTNYPVRQYQAAIVRSALFKNTLVSLPTGLGKTFIAAVVMYNFYRWYPRSKVVFMAPTRPLVAQQIKACYNIMGIPPDDTTEMTGALATEIREKMWREKRVFFLTPQVMANDLRSNICPASLVKCVVFDEAHKAVKEFAYCQVVKLLAAADCVYRTLALSATPGNDINAVIQVIRNLNISHLEMRGEDSIDVAQYTHGKSIENVVVELSPELLRVKDDFMQVYERFARSLVENRALTSNIAFQSKFQILKSMEKFRANPPRGMSSSLIGSLVSDFTMCMTFAHALELLQIYGLRAFYRYLADESGEKSKAATTRLRNNEDLQRMLRKLHDLLYPKPGSDVPYTWGHPKLKILVNSLSEHFKSAEEKGEKTKAIIFCQYKVVVNEIVDLLSKCKPHVQAALFVGQSGGKERGMPQSKQLQIMKDFREGKINCLVATCVAEEGLDIGEVDLIILMEAQKSPVRLVQRLGRTGRKRRGRCIVLLTKGKEEGKFHEAMASRKSYVRNIVESKAVKNNLCQYSPPMIPPGTKPNQQLVHIKVTCVPTPSKPVKASKKQMDIRDCAVPESRPFLNYEEAQKVEEELGESVLEFNQLPSKVELWHRRSGPSMGVDELLNGGINQLSYWNDWNTDVHQPFVISNTLPSETYCHLMSYNMHQEADEYLKLIEAYDTGGVIPLPKAREDGPSKAHNAGEDENEVDERRKKSKKKTAPKKNYGVDIRSCMAAGVQKVHKRPRLDSTEDDVIIVETDDDGSNHMEAEVGINPVELNYGMPNASIEGAIKKRNSIQSASREEFDIAGIFGMESDEFENALYSENMLCGLEADIGMCLRLSKIFSDPPIVPKPKFLSVEVLKFQCDQLLKLMDTVSEISLAPTKESFKPVLSGKQEYGAMYPVTIGPGDLEDKKEVEMAAAKNYSFVDVDDLFGDDDVFNDVNLNCGSIPERGILPNQDEQKAPLLKKLETNIKDNVELSPIPKNEFSSVWGSNSVFAELSPIGKAPPQVHRPLISSTPINPRKPGIRPESPLAQPPKEQDNQWLLDDILEENEVFKKSLSDPHQSSKDLFATTPDEKLAPANIPPEPGSRKAKSDADEDFWCLDDLFEDENQEYQSKDPKNETSFYGITQMVSQIERDKLRNRQSNEPVDVSAMSSSVCAVPSKQAGAVSSQNTSPARQADLKSSSGKDAPGSGSSLSSKLQENIDRFDAFCGQRNVDPPCTLKNTTISTIHILDSDSEDEMPNRNTEPVLKASTALKRSSQTASKNTGPVLKESTVPKTGFQTAPKNTGPVLKESSALKTSSQTTPKNTGLVLKESSAPKSSQNYIPIVVIDSDSCSPPISESQGNERPNPNKSDQSKKSNQASSNLLDEDDDIFNMLCNDGFEETKQPKQVSAQNTKRTAQYQNFKKFKRKSLLSHLDSEPENDFPPEKRDKAPDETFNMRVGSSSKRKLSFEDLLGDIGDEAASKYFASNPPKEPDKRVLNLSSFPLSSVPSSRIPEPLQNSPSEEDIFIRPLAGKSTEKSVSQPATSPLVSPSPVKSKSVEVSRNETSASSSVSTSPVKAPQKKKTKKSCKRKGHEFIENEADESGTVSTDDSDNSSLDDMDDSFVNDESDQELSYAHYLKTVKSPVAGGQFKIPINRRYMGNVYSQVVSNVDDEYENDSFCVDSDEGNSPDDCTILERAERKLLKKKSAGPTKKRVVQPESDDSDCDERVVDLNVLTALPVPNQKPKRRLLESDSDVTPERPPAKRPRNRIISPVEGEKTPKSEVTPTTSGDFVIPRTIETLPTSKPTTTTAKQAIQIDSDSDEDLKKALRLSVLESVPKKSAEEKFEEDLQKALFLSQCEVAGPSKPVDIDKFPSPGDRGTSLLFMSQSMLLDKKPLSTKSRTKTKTTINKGSKTVFELSDSD